MHRLRNIQGSEAFDHRHLGPGYAAVRLLKGHGGLWNGRGVALLCVLVVAGGLLLFLAARANFA
jgi:hypothetical protein